MVILLFSALFWVPSLALVAADSDELTFAIETVDKQGVHESSTAIAVDSSDRPHICYVKDVYFDGGGSTELRYARYNGSSWKVETVDGVLDFSYGSCSLVLDSNGYPHIGYEDAGVLKYAYLDGSSWVIEIVDTKGHFAKPSLAMDSQSNPHISYLEGDSRDLKYARSNGLSWLIETIDSFGRTDWSQSIALDSDDNPHIVCNFDSMGIDWIFHAYFNGTSWVTETVGSGYHVSMAIDSLDNIHVSCARAEGLGYHFYKGTTWITQIVADTIGDYVLDTSIALGSHGDPYIAYWERSGYDLKLAYYSDASWNVRIVDSAGSVGPGNSIALDSRDYPHITYLRMYMFRPGDLKHAFAGISPIASFTYSPSEPVGIVSFDASTSYDPDGTIVSYAWDFGDGTTIAETDPLTTHVYMTAGNYTVVLSVTDSDGFKETTTQFVTTAKLFSTISISLSSSTSYVGFNVGIIGNLTYNETSLSGVPILLSYSVTRGESWNDISLINTVSDGSYLAVWMPSATGNYIVRAAWSGNATYWGVNTTVSFAVIPFKEQNVFTVTSNSTISELAFNSTSRELSFTVTYPWGRTGYAKVHIAKTLVENIADVKAYLDGDQINYTTALLSDSWLLHLTYLHSTHKITIDLGQLSTPFIETPLGKVLIFGVPITAIAILALFLLRKSMHKLLEPRKTKSSETEKPKK